MRICTTSEGKGSHRGGGKEGKTDHRCFPVVSGAGALATLVLDCRAKAHVNGGPPKSALRGNGVGNCQDE